MRVFGLSVLKAMRHPGLVALIFGFRLLVALIFAWPLTRVLSPVWVMSQPRRDQTLFEPGSELLLRLISENRQVILHLLRVDLWIIAAVIVVGTVPSTYVLIALRDARGSSANTGLRAMLHSVPRQVGIVVSYWVAVAAAAALAKSLFPLIPALVYPWFGEKGADVALAALMGSLALTIITLRLVCDLARASAIESPANMTTICGLVLRDLGCRTSFWLKAIVLWGLLMAAVPLLAESLVLTCATSSTLKPGPVFIHQGTVLALCVLQLGWWALAIDNTEVP